MEESTQVLPPPSVEPISRPSSTSTSASANLQQLPGISALAASNAASNAEQESPQLRATAAPQNPTYVGATPGGMNGTGNLPTCQNCTTSTTPLWRRDEFGSVLCNACGLFLKLHGRPRPISLKTDVIKSRNRVKTIRPDLSAKKKQQQQQVHNLGLGSDVNEFSAQNAAAQAIRRTSQKSNGNEGSDSPISRTGTPSMYNQTLPFMVDDPYQTGGFNGTGTSENGDRDTPQTHEQLIAHNSSLKTRVSELEVINELFRGRLSQLEQQEAAARRGQEVAGAEQTQLRTQLEATQESEGQLRAQLEDSHRRENNLKRRLDELEEELKAAKEGTDGLTERPNKKARVEQEAAETPAVNGEGEVNGTDEVVEAPAEES